MIADHKVHIIAFVSDNRSCMKSLLPLKSPVESTSEGSRVISLSEEAADEVFETLSSSTSRQVLSLLYEEPRPATELADETETTVQNIRYHLDKLSSADLIAVADTWYSEKGTEMKVYAPTESALVVCAGRESTTDRLKSRIKELLGAVGIFGLASLVVQYLVTTYLETETAAESSSGSDAGAMSVETTDAASAAEQATGGGLTEFLTEPGVIFFVGCLLALVIVLVAVQYRAD